MKICPRCQAQFPDDFSFCLEDGSTLKDYEAFDSAATVAVTDMATFEFQNPPTGKQNTLTNENGFGKPPRKSRKTAAFGVLLALILLGAAAATVGTLFYFRRPATTQPSATTAKPSPTVQNSSVIFRASEDTEGNLHAEILGKVKNNSGEDFFKCKITNVGETVARPYNISLIFYKDDVMVEDAFAILKLQYLKPQQSITVWVPLNGIKDYTSIKIKQPIATLPLTNPPENLFPELILKDAKMEVTSSDIYEVQGIVENTNYEKISPQVFVLFYDEKSEMVGIEKGSLHDLQMGDKAKFKVSVSNINLFGKPKTFEVIFIADY